MEIHLEQSQSVQPRQDWSFDGSLSSNARPGQDGPLGALSLTQGLGQKLDGLRCRRQGRSGFVEVS